MQNLLQQIAQKASLTPDLQYAILNYFEPIEAQKGDILLSEGKKAHYLYFVEKGILHNYSFHNGKQITSWFYTEQQFITAWSSFYAQKSSFETIECLENCKLYRISYSNYQKLIADFPSFGNFARLLAEEILTFLDEFAKNWSFLSAKEKYQLLLSYFPEIELRVKLSLIASFLGISQETLSRIRAGK